MFARVVSLFTVSFMTLRAFSSRSLRKSSVLSSALTLKPRPSRTSKSPDMSKFPRQWKALARPMRSSSVISRKRPQSNNTGAAPPAAFFEGRMRTFPACGSAWNMPSLNAMMPNASKSVRRTTCLSMPCNSQYFLSCRRMNGSASMNSMTKTCLPNKRLCTRGTMTPFPAFRSTAPARSSARRSSWKSSSCGRDAPHSSANFRKSKSGAQNTTWFTTIDSVLTSSRNTLSTPSC
mmetsp:Transcript_109155/g.341405  ORF Transcript_109155/g.341405 Transcript_109155/m.341405 type:complete len:234 (-) Transcript_109155:336-1037(-)